MLAVKWIEKILVVCVRFLEFYLSHGIVRNKNIKLSTVKPEYIATNSCCAQIIWIKQQLNDYGINFETVLIKSDNTNIINLTKNLILHSQTKHIEIRHHFIMYHFEKDERVIKFVASYNQLIYIFSLNLFLRNSFYKS